MKFLKILVIVVLASLSFQSCKDNKEYKKLEKAPAQAMNSIHEIVVNEVVEGGGYTYLNVEEGKSEYWMAITSSDVIAGETYYYSGGIQMKDFESKQLGKTFDFITFAETVSANKEELSKVDVKSDPHKAVTEAKKDKMIDKMAKNDGEIYLEEIFNNKNSYANKEVEVKGIVVKVNTNLTVYRITKYIQVGCSFWSVSLMVVVCKVSTCYCSTITIAYPIKNNSITNIDFFIRSYRVTSMH